MHSMFEARISTTLTAATTDKTPSPSTTLSFPNIASKKCCIFGCRNSSASLCRFPVHSQTRCNNWLKFFRISAEHINQFGGLENLCVCLKHFNDTQQMAKTRIKTTPTRMQKDALLASAAAAVTDDVKTRLRQPNCTTPSKEHLNTTSTIIVAAPKRTNSISSATSTISHISETHSALSDIESPVSPRSAVSASSLSSSSNVTATIALQAKNISQKAQQQQHQNQNNLLCKGATTTATATASAVHQQRSKALLKNRKVYMITEKCSGEDETTEAAQYGQKRKMYLIMEQREEEEQQGQHGTTQYGINAQKHLKTENGFATSNAPKKLTLFADKSDGELTQKFEKILPEILHRIQTKDNNMGGVPSKAEQITQLICMPKEEKDEEEENDAVIDRRHVKHVVEERLPITLPPKKNRTKIITTNVDSEASICHQRTQQIRQISAATPVIVSTASLMTTTTTATSLIKSNQSNNHSSNNNGCIKLINGLQHQQSVQVMPHLVPQKNINLSTDFLFLMKMLPKLESIPEPHKNHVKNCIEKIITQNASMFEKQ